MGNSRDEEPDGEPRPPYHLQSRWQSRQRARRWPATRQVAEALDEIARIGRIGHRGDGIAGTSPQAVYVPLALPGELVRIGPGDGRRAELREILEASPDRVEPFCPRFGRCGGCSLQHWREAPYRAWKRDLVAAAFGQRGIAVEVEDLVDAHGAGRRRATFHAARAGNRIEVGFMGLRSRRIVDLDRCPVLSAGLGRAPSIARDLAGLLARGRPIDIALTETDTGLDCDVRGVGEAPAALKARLADLARRHDLARLSLGGDTVAETRAPALAIGAARVALPPGAFLQPTAEGERALWEAVRARLGSPKHVADLFCGVGPFALRLAASAKVWALDGDRAAVAALATAARSTAGLKPIAAEPRDLFRAPLMASELKGIDAVVLDPPRQGAEAQAAELAKSAAPLVVAVSCDPATLARDAAILLGGGYRVGPVTPVDQFKWTPHVECVAAFARN